jgi:putative ABC exporter
VDRALWLLLGLRLKAWLRRFRRSMGSAKGITLTVFGLLVFVAWMLPAVLSRRHLHDPAYYENVRRFWPWGLLGYSIFTLLMATGERAISFSPAEVNLLFPAPLSRRQLLGYKIIASLGLCLLSGLFMSLFMANNTSWFVGGYVGMVLGLMFLQLFAMAVALVSASLGAAAFSWRRRMVLGLIVLVIAAALWQIGLTEALQLPRLELLAKLEKSLAVQVVLAPFRWIVLAFTAERLWPDLIQWASLALLVDVALAVFVLVLDAQYLEISAAASAKVYARIERMRKGGAGATLRTKAGKPRFHLPMPPTWQGVGPIAWRQATGAARDFARLLSLLLVFGALTIPTVVSMPKNGHPEVLLAIEATLMGMTMFLIQAVPFDFRADLDRMAELKALPIASSRLALGQLLTPVLIVTLLQAMTLVVIAAVVRFRVPPLFWAIGSFALPFNLLLFAIENLMFLWFPTRLNPSTPGDLQHMGRVVLLLFSRLFCLAIAGGIAALVGVAVFFLTGRSWPAGLGTAWLALLAVALGLIPLIALAFRQFDVARDSAV